MLFCVVQFALLQKLSVILIVPIMKKKNSTLKI